MLHLQSIQGENGRLVEASAHTTKFQIVKRMKSVFRALWPFGETLEVLVVTIFDGRLGRYPSVAIQGYSDPVALKVLRRPPRQSITNQTESIKDGGIQCVCFFQLANAGGASKRAANTRSPRGPGCSKCCNPECPKLSRTTIKWLTFGPPHGDLWRLPEVGPLAPGQHYFPGV